MAHSRPTLVVRLLQFLLDIVLELILNLFFSHINCVGRESIPTKGPVIFVGNHQNQFVDGLLLTCKTPRRVRFIVAAKSMVRPIIGGFARAMGAIPVTRAQDLATTATGLVRSEGVRVTGEGTLFTKEIVAGDKLRAPGCSEDQTPRVVSVESDTELTLAEPFPTALTAPAAVKVFKHLDHSKMFDAAWQTLADGNCMAIFPEGGSHDRTDLLPLKPGIAIIAIGAVLKHGVNVQIVPCGLNYMTAHQFRSEVIVEYGKPFHVPHDIVADYQKGNKVDACNRLMKIVEARLRQCIITVPDYHTLQVVRVARRLYQPDNIILPVRMYMELHRRFAAAYQHLGDQPAIADCSKRISDYLAKIKAIHIKDKDVSSFRALPNSDRILQLVLRLTYVAVLVALILPGFLLNVVGVVVCENVAKKESRKALRNSNVKIKGFDVVASYYLLTAIAVGPLLHTVYALLVALFFGFKAMLYFVTLDMILSYAAVKLSEEAWLMWRSCIPLRRQEEFAAVAAERRELQKHLRRVIEEYGPKLGEEVWSHRIIAKESLEEESAGSDTDDHTDSESLFKVDLHTTRPRYTLRTQSSNFSIMDGLEKEGFVF